MRSKNQQTSHPDLIILNNLLKNCELEMAKDLTSKEKHQLTTKIIFLERLIAIYKEN